MGCIGWAASASLGTFLLALAGAMLVSFSDAIGQRNWSDL